MWKTVIQFLVVTLVLAGVSVLTFLGYYGYFGRVEFRETTIENEWLVYKPMIGDYAQAKPLLDTVYHQLLGQYGIDSKVGFGIYYDNPSQVPTNQLRSHIGCLVPDSVVRQHPELASRFGIRQLSHQATLQTVFPYKGGASILVGLMKVYPALQSHLAAKGQQIASPVMEVYDVPQHRIEYRVLYGFVPEP